MTTCFCFIDYFVAKACHNGNGSFRYDGVTVEEDLRIHGNHVIACIRALIFKDKLRGSSTVLILSSKRMISPVENNASIVVLASIEKDRGNVTDVFWKPILSRSNDA